MPVAILFCLTPLLTAGCQSHNQDSGVSSGGIQAPAATTSLRGSDVVATVNGDPITVGEMYDSLQHYVPQRVPGFPNNPDLNQPTGQSALRNLIESEITLQFAKASGTPVTDAQLTDYYNDQEMIQEAKDTLPFDKVLSLQGYTVDSYKQEVLAPQVAQFNVLEKAENLTPGDLMTQYNSTQAQYVIPARVHLHRVELATKQDAQNVYAGIKGGRPMSDFAGVNLGSDGGNPDDTTDLARWIDPNLAATFGPSVAAQLFKAKPGDLLQPVSVQGRWWVMQVVDSKPKQPLPYDQVKSLVRVNLIHARAGTAGQGVQQEIFQALHSAQIKIDQPQYQGVAMEIHMLGIGSPVQAPATAPAPPLKKK